MRGWVCWVVPEKRAGCSSVEVNPRWWRNFINLTYCSWWQRDTEDREKQISDDRNQKRERETCVGAEAANSTETFLWSNNSAVNSFIPDWTRLSCFRLLFLAARPARWLRPLMTPPETVTPRDGRRQTITNFLLSQSVRDAKTQNSHTVFTTSRLLVETFWGWWNDFPHYFWSGST